MKAQALFLCLFLLPTTLGTIVTTAMVVALSSTNIDTLVKRSLHLLDSLDSTQVFIGIAGGPGSGKSTIAESVRDAVNSHCGEQVAIVVPMDGYHYSRSKLQEMGNSGIVVVGDVLSRNGGTTATYSDLMSRRGAPWTFDSQALIRDLQQAKQDHQGNFPIYSREISDPVPNGVVLNPSHKIIYCEGNYLCAFRDTDWQPLAQVWDETWYVSVPEQVVKERLVSRHLERWNDEKVQLWGNGREGALRKVEASDLKNHRWIQKMSRGHADVVIEN